MFYAYFIIQTYHNIFQQMYICVFDGMDFPIKKIALSHIIKNHFGRKPILTRPKLKENGAICPKVGLGFLLISFCIFICFCNFFWVLTLAALIQRKTLKIKRILEGETSECHATNHEHNVIPNNHSVPM